MAMLPASPMTSPCCTCHQVPTPTPSTLAPSHCPAAMRTLLVTPTVTSPDGAPPEEAAHCLTSSRYMTPIMMKWEYYAIHCIVGIMVTWFSALGSLGDNLIQNARMTTVYHAMVTQLTDMHQGHKGSTCWGNNTQHHLNNILIISNFPLAFTIDALH